MAQSETLLHLLLKQVIRYWNKSRQTCRIILMLPYLFQNYLSLRSTTCHCFSRYSISRTTCHCSSRYCSISSTISHCFSRYCSISRTTCHCFSRYCSISSTISHCFSRYSYISRTTRHCFSRYCSISSTISHCFSRYSSVSRTTCHCFSRYCTVLDISLTCNSYLVLRVMETVVSAEMFIPILETTWHPILENNIVLVTAMKMSDLHLFH